jgi:hypothetical protein
MGILGIRILADYGEGRAREISRLFEAIIRITGDVSIFNWAGAYYGSKAIGRSLYPTDFDAYQDIPSETYLDDKDERAYPSYALNSITLGQMGIHPRFDICEIKDILIKTSNEDTLHALVKLEQNLESTSSRELKSNLTNSDCAFSSSLTFFNKTCEAVHTLSPLKSVRALLEGLVDTRKPPSL